MDAVGAFAQNVDAITFEFENVSSSVASACQHLGVPVRPGSWVLNVAQERIREKEFLSRSGLPVTEHAPVHSLQDLEAAADRIGSACRPQNGSLWL